MPLQELQSISCMTYGNPAVLLHNTHGTAMYTYMLAFVILVRRD